MNLYCDIVLSHTVCHFATLYVLYCAHVPVGLCVFIKKFKVKRIPNIQICLENESKHFFFIFNFSEYPH